MPGVTHVIGAGLAGLAAAVALVERGRRVALHEAAPKAGGRCRSYRDPTLGIDIDNGNHLLLSGNRAALAFLARIGAADRVAGPSAAEITFHDLADDARWTLRLNDGPVPWWALVPSRRAPGARAIDHLAAARLMTAGGTIAEAMPGDTPLHRRLWNPVFVSALNTHPREASAKLAWAVVRETFAKGGRACRPLVAVDGLSRAFVEPALAFLAARGASFATGRRLRAFAFEGRRVARLDFGEDEVALGPRDAVVLAVPAQAAAALVPGLVAPDEFRAIVNGHFLLAPPPSLPPILGLVGGTVEWLFAYPGRLSTTTSDADRLVDTPREELARLLWEDVRRATGLGAMPPWQIVREKRATFAATPAQDAKRPEARTRWANLVLAGDWTRTGLPATIEGAIRSGERAAQMLAN
jgi:squalene-associated FAD-dependent desaturase